ncbi:interleukin-23 subunit alpha [Ochotona princeps]|uniref:interleukin-23 subunit alpha n=1 Tax=Ochotona princeps TaxID=9978 RepID=UPI0027154C6A|nr:interleukin-23 subunit alpha [Ochotona princeps]
MRFEMQAGMLLPLLLLLLLPTAQVWAMPVDSGLDWTQCQQLSQQLCTLAWNAHPLGAHVVSDSVLVGPPSPKAVRGITFGLRGKAEGGFKVIWELEVGFLGDSLKCQSRWGSEVLIVSISSLFLLSSQDLREEGDEETSGDIVPRIQCEDGCDPQGLRDNTQSCLRRIRQGLRFYEKLLGSDIFIGEPDLFPDGPVGQLHASLLGLSQLLQPKDRHQETHPTTSLSQSQPWQRPLLRFKILRSLQAFLAVAARVFAHGAATLSP